MTHDELLSKTDKSKRYSECLICGLVVANVVTHLNYSHPKIKTFCTECNGSGRRSISAFNQTTGIFTIYDCTECKGSGKCETEKRK